MPTFDSMMSLTAAQPFIVHDGSDLESKPSQSSLIVRPHTACRSVLLAQVGGNDGGGTTGGGRDGSGVNGGYGGSVQCVALPQAVTAASEVRCWQGSRGSRAPAKMKLRP